MVKTMTLTLEPEVFHQMVDKLRLLFHARITRRSIVQMHKDSTGDMKQIVERMDESIERYEQAVLETLPRSNAKWLENELEKDKLFDVASLIELTARIGSEENTEKYDEFLALVVDLLENVFYAQKNRKNIHFGKYKALFKLIGDELRRDTNREASQLWFRDGKLWMCAMVPDCKPVEVKD